jgi:hypothetical protein
MRIKRIEKWVWGFRGKQMQVTFHDEENDRTYGRVISALGWPYGERPGAVVCLAESWEQDHSLQYSPRHVLVIDEFFSLDLEQLYRSVLDFRDRLCSTKLFGDPHSNLQCLWRDLGIEGQRLFITEPPRFKEIDLNYTVQILRKRTSLQKTLHFGGGCSLPGLLSAIPVEKIEEKNALERHPSIAALGYALAVMERPLSSEHFTPTRAKRFGSGRRRP